MGAAPGLALKGRLGLLTLLCATVLGLHLSLVAWLNEHLPVMQESAGPNINRMNVAFVQELQPAQPAVAALAMPPAPAQPRSARAVAPAASAASAALAVRADRDRDGGAVMPDQLAQAASPHALTPLEAFPESPPEPAQAPEPLPASELPQRPADLPAPNSVAPLADLLQVPAATPSAGLSATANQARVATFEWPLSTRLSYDLVGDYRGPVQGSAQVEWLRLGSRYQVHLDVSIGGGVVMRRLSSEGLLGAEGLQPQRYEEVTKTLLSAPRSRGVRFEGDRVILANGKSEPTLPQVQDTASQFVQLSWLFTTQSHRLKAGERIEVPLALPGRIDRWHYEVQAEDDLDLPVGRIRAFHMKPRRMQAPPGELVVETWFAPSLQYLPVRILIRQDAQTFVDLLLSRLPQQAAADKGAR